MPSMSIDEVNILIWKFMLENGYPHTAFSFGEESEVKKSQKVCAFSELIPHGALVRIILKGIQYTEAEKAGTNAMSISLLEAAMRLNPDYVIPATEPEAKVDDEEFDEEEYDEELDEDEEEEEDEENSSKTPRVETEKRIESRRQTVDESSGHKTDGSTPPVPILLNPLFVKNLSGHTSEAFICSWNPKHNIVASGSGDATGRMWYLENAFEASATLLQTQCKVLKHSQNDIDLQSRQVNHDVTSLDWSCNGEMLATGCYDGLGRIWNREGILLSSLDYHKGPIFAVKWNPTAEYLVTAGVDRSTIVWNADGTKKTKFVVHDSSALDVDWVSRDEFASCSTDKKIVICKINCQNPIQTLYGHQNEVNAIRFDSHSRRIASCSDDKTLKIWSVDQQHALHTYTGHTKEIYTLRWNPHGFLVATASFDHTVRLFDVEKGQCARVFQGHTDPVYSVSWSNDGRLVASGCFDRSVFLWDVRTGHCVAKYIGDKNNGGIFEVSWCNDNQKLAASASDGKIILMDVRTVVG